MRSTSPRISRTLAGGIAALALAAVVLPTGSGAQVGISPTPARGSSLLVAPTRLVFEGRQRTAELTLVNRGTETATYRIVFSQMRMSESGRMKEIAEAGPGEQFADSLVRYSPRQVTLGPNESQSVRLQLRKPADLAPGEYRSHLVFRYVPEVAPAAAPEQQAQASGLAVRLTPLVGVAIPVIVRQGETRADVRVTDVALEDGERPGLRAVLHRDGDRSVLGDVVVRARGADGSSRELARLGRLGIYTPNPLRHVAVPIRLEDRQALGPGEVLEIVYLDAEEGPGRGSVLAAASFRMP